MKQTNYFPHDYHARHDPELEKVFYKHGCEGMGIYWIIVEMMYEQGGYLKIEDIEHYANALRTKKEIINSIINDFNLFKKNDTRFYSETLMSRLKFITEKSKKAMESANKRWHNNANAIQTQCDGNAIKEKKRKEIKEKRDIYVEIIAYWNSKPSLPKVNVLSDKRKAHLSARLNDPFFMGNWKSAIDKICLSHFCMGDSDRGWKATFDWILQPDVVIKIMEGKYDNPKTKAQKELDETIRRGEELIKK